MSLAILVQEQAGDPFLVAERDEPELKRSLEHQDRMVVGLRWRDNRVRPLT